MIRPFYERVRACIDDLCFEKNQAIYSVAHRTLHLHYATSSLFAQLHRALHQQQIHGTTGELTLYVWDSASTGMPMVPSPFPPQAFGRRHSVHGVEDDGITISYDVWSGALSLINFERNEAIWWCADAQQLPAYEWAAPFRTIFQQWFATQGTQFVHTAAIGDEQGAVLFAGASGAGKSTTAMHCLGAGLRFVGEDYCLVDENAHVHSLYNSVKLTAQSIDRLPTLAVPTAAGDDGKTIFWLYPTYPIADNLPIQAILLPQIVTQAATTVARTTASAALRALAPTTIFQLAASGQAALQRLARLAAAVPAYHLSIGQDATLMTAAIRTLLSGQA